MDRKTKNMVENILVAVFIVIVIIVTVAIVTGTINDPNWLRLP